MVSSTALVTFLLSALSVRAQINVTLLLTLASVKAATADFTPKSAESTVLDVYILRSFLFVIIIILENSLVSTIFGTEEFDENGDIEAIERAIAITLTSVLSSGAWHTLCWSL